MRFRPILKEKVWGGTKLSELFGKDKGDKIGESWELSGVENNISIVLNGSLSGNSLVSLIDEYKEQLVGTKVYKRFGSKFPLLFKFIDASEDLSVQLHPNDSLAKSRHNSFGKTEMWYILHTEKDARLILGFKNDITEAEYLEKLSEKKITDILHPEPVKVGDAFFIEPGTVHAIGAGIVLAEIQQTSDVTYRIYDWDRPDIDGELRELHTDLAREAIDYKTADAKLKYTNKSNSAIQLCSTAYFETNKLVVTRTVERDYSNLDSFVVYMCVDGKANVEIMNTSEEIKKGETILIPACEDMVRLTSSNATILEIYIP
ncbi:mannose-6-phosphate isomerase type 1 [Ulvibacter antarcticus]|uniref:Phosphohexomutase n=1 Tax=Ulvibacter antarcticus TaxID=442714 RepID=A0A3L9YDE4_9FLAO|nr:mannose-6-phosphate isomerase type 1 [Ulvibacter antarcticus]